MLKRLLSPALKQRLKTWLAALDHKAVVLCSRSRVTSVLYYLILRPSFGREQHAVLAGRARHLHELKVPAFSSAQLRRNIHRLEKALIMQPRKAIFALEYIDQTIDLFERCLSRSEFSPSELEWAQAVLAQYFAVVTPTPHLSQLANKFCLLQQQRSQVTPETGRITPYPAADKVVADISPEALYSLMQQRRSVRWFTEQPVPADLVAQAIQMASQAPSACNRQPFFVKMSLQPDQAASIAKLAMGTSGFADNIRCLCVIVGDQSCYEAERDRHVIYVDGGLFAMQLMLALETLGLSSCPINWPDIESLELKMQRRLKLAVFHRPVMLLAVGYANQSGGIPASVKKTSDQLLQTIDD